MDLSQYRLETLHQDGEFILYRGLRQNLAETSPPSFLALSPLMERPAPTTIKKIEHEFSLKDELDPAWAIRPIALAQQQSRTMLLFEDPNGEPLDRLLRGPMELKQFLRCGIALAAALGQVHRRGLVHKDIKPSNVLANATVDQVWLMGFGIASRLRRERQLAEPPEFIAGTLAYMAPEQTGRMNHSIDSRSDLYALGITLYELLTGSLPFTASDPMEWVHCHIAKQPLPPAERVRDIPRSVSAIVMKLLAKTPEQRYQTAAGVESDLRRCLEDSDRERGVHDFALGEHDRPDRLQIPEKLYGREHEIETLLASFDRVVKSGTPELVLVSGYSGIGKSSVVNELHKVLVPPRGLLASGKFDQYKRDMPYSTLAQALRSLTRHLVAKSEADLVTWRDAIHEALGPNGRLIIDVVPELKLIIGVQPPVPEVPPQDAQRRFQLVFRRFIGVFARPEHPLALFFDDLQWVDSATLEVLQDLLMQADVRHLLMIGAYRDNEVDTAHPLARKLEGIRRAGAGINEIKLAPLSQKNVAQLVTDALQCQPDRVLPLAQLVCEKTAGNPFFAIQFISALEHERLLTFDHEHGRWTWDLGHIRARGYTDNVVDLMIGKLRHLPAETQRALQELACLGNAATVTTLSLVYGTGEAQVHSDLFEAVRAEMVERQESSYKFIHDRIREAAYSLIPEAQRPEGHLRIGRLLLSHTSPEAREEAIFEILNQLNRGAALIGSRDEREQLAELNLIAGKRAKAAAVYALALNYLIAGAALVPKDGWERRHDLIFELEFHRAECEFLTGEMASAEERLTMLSSRAADAVQRAAVACLAADVYWALQRPERGLTDCLECLRDVGLDIPIHPTNAQAQTAYGQICSKLDGVGIDELVERPLLTDPASRAILNVLVKALPSAVTVDKNLMSLIVCAAVDISLERGHCDSSCFAYEYLGFIAAWNFSDFEAGLRFGRLGYELVQRKGLRRFEAFVSLILSSCIMPWAKHIASCRELVRTTFDVANKIGDRISAVSSRGQVLVSNLLFAGEPLVEAEKEAEVGLEFCRRAAFSDYIASANIQAAFIRNLRGLTRPFGSLDDERFDELQMRDHWASKPHLLACEFWYWVRRLQARFFAGDYSAAIDASIRAQGRLSESPSALEQVEYELYSALTHAVVCDSASPDDRERHLNVVAAHLRQLEVWARHCPENFENRAALVGAEIARIENRDLVAMRLYEKAIQSSRANGFINNEALAYERAASFYRSRGFEQIADTYLRNASACYASWGADGKVRQLDRLYPGLKEPQPLPSPGSTITAPIEGLDLATVIRVLQAVSGEIVLEKLFDTVMSKAMEHAGAERGLLIVPRGDELRIEADSRISGNDVIVCLRDVSVTGADMPESILRYVLRTHESVILDDASSANPFSAEPYFLQRRVRSILCLPLLNQAKLSGILYLENNLAPRVFTSDRITVLKMLVSQAAISLENTRLYRDLEDREAKIRRLVDANVVGIVMWNLDGAITGANEAFLRMVQYDREDLASGRVRWTDLTPAEWRNLDESAIAELKASGVFQPVEKEYFRKDGSRVPILVGGALFENSGNEGVAFIFDLSEQKRAEDRLRAVMSERTRLSTVRAEIAMALASKGTLREILHRCAETMVRHLGAAFARIWTFRSGGAELELEASAGMYTRLDGRFSRIPVGELKVGLIARERKALMTNDVQNDPQISDHNWARAEKMQSFAGYPLVVEDRVVGVVGMFSRQTLTESTLETLAFIADGIAQGIDRKRAEDALKLLKDRLQDENVVLREQVNQAFMFEEIVGSSPALLTVFSRVSKVAPTDSTVLITGETGTGKELVARAIHKRSKRSTGAFISVNCAAIPRDLIASELFGHEKGAFTGATQRRIGRFELAEGGTIFLDEVGDLPAETQISLLRVLQEHEFERIGGNERIAVSVRVIAATNRDLQAAIVSGAFRNDLFFRLNVFPIEMSPLRERREDIPLLVEYFIDRFARKAGKVISKVSKKTLQLLEAYPWPGNIRELQNVIERSVVVCESESFSIDESWLSRQPETAKKTDSLNFYTKFAAQEKEVIENALRESGGRVFGPSGAAEKLGIPRSTLESRIRALKINKNRFKNSPS